MIGCEENPKESKRIKRKQSNESKKGSVMNP
jgi:hypothetical protein